MKIHQLHGDTIGLVLIHAINSCKLSDSVSLNESDFVNATTGFEGGFRNFDMFYMTQ